MKALPRAWRPGFTVSKNNLRKSFQALKIFIAREPLIDQKRRKKILKMPTVKSLLPKVRFY
jgi:hypothetical protein